MGFSPPFFIGGKMEFILYGLFFITGWLVHAVVAYVLSLGSSVMLFQRTIEDCLLVVGRTYEGYVTRPRIQNGELTHLPESPKKN